MPPPPIKPPTEKDLDEIVVQPSLLESVKSHWKENLPKLYKAYQKSGKLQEKAKRAVQEAKYLAASLVAQGQEWSEAWVTASREKMYLEPEESLDDQESAE